MRNIALILALTLFPAFTFSQISPATRPHTHAGASSGGSTLSITSLTVTEANPGSVVLSNTSGAAAGFQAQGSAGDQWRVQTGLLVQGDFGIRNASQAINALIFATGAAPNATFTASVASTKSCAAGYTRVGPNFCRVNTFGNIAWADAVACTQTAWGGAAIPSDATAALIGIQWQSLSNNAIANRTNSVTFHANTGCTSAVSFSLFTTREFAAVVAGTVIGETTNMLVVPLCTTNTVCTQQTNAGGNGNSDVTNWSVFGYYD